MEDGRLRGKTVLITGAARGLGAETARRVAARGANVALVGLEPEELERVAAQCGAERRLVRVRRDRHRGARARPSRATVERFGGIDVVMANAGIAPVGMVRSTDPAAFERTIEINLLGVWRTVRACLPHVIERQGYVLVIASLAAAAARPRAWRPTRPARRAPRRSRTRCASEMKSLGVDVGVGYFALHRHRHGARRRRPSRRSASLRKEAPGPFSKTYPLSTGRQGHCRRHRAAPPLGGRAGLGPRAAGAAHGAGAAARQGLATRPPPRPTRCS